MLQRGQAQESRVDGAARGKRSTTTGVGEKKNHPFLTLQCFIFVHNIIYTVATGI